MVLFGKLFDSLEPILSSDPSSVETEKVEMDPAAVACVEIVNADKRLEAQVVGKSVLTLLAWVDDEGPFDASLALKVDGNFFTVGLHKSMSARDIVEAIERRLPPGYQAATRDSSQSEVLIINILKPSQAKRDPELHFLSTDPSQLFKWAGKNKLRIEGRAAKGLQSLRSHLELVLEGHRVRLPLERGDFPISTAKRLRDALPKMFTALIELPLVAGGDVTLTILRRR
jgi:hypothetical protein